MDVSEYFDRSFKSKDHWLLADYVLRMVANHDDMLGLEKKFGVFGQINEVFRLQKAGNEEAM